MENINKLDRNRPLPVLPKKFVTANPAEADLLLARDGKAEATIVFAPGAADAAIDLEKHLRKITGAEFSLVPDRGALPAGNVILVGHTAKTKELGEGVFEAYPKGEGYTIRREGNILMLVGNDDGLFMGTQHAVTRFLEEAGCRWLAPEALWQTTPKANALAVREVNRHVKPRFEARKLSAMPAAVRDRWYLGGKDTMVGHLLPSIVPAKEYAEHPEFFGELNGSRDPSRFEYWQYCYTNKELAKRVAAAAIAYFDNHPYATNYTVAANDGWNDGWCECEVCSKGNHADQLLSLANNVGRIVKEKHPEKHLTILCYHSTFIPPVYVKAEDNVEVMFCLESSPFEDFSAGSTTHLGQNPITRFHYDKPWKETIAAYIENANLKTRTIWGWYCLSADYPAWKTIPWVQGNTITRNLQQFEDMGMSEVFFDSFGEPLDLRWPLFYACSKGMYDGETDAETLLYDTCCLLYGAAAEDLFLYYRSLADTALEHPGRSICVTWVPDEVGQIYREDHAHLDSLMKRALSKLDHLTDEQRQRVLIQSAYWDTVAEKMDDVSPFAEKLN